MPQVTQYEAANARGFRELRTLQEKLDDSVSLAFEMNSIAEIVADSLFEPGVTDISENQAHICGRALNAISRLASLQAEQIDNFDTAMSRKLGIALIPDPLVQAIEAYRLGCEKFNATPESSYANLGGEDHIIDVTYGYPMDHLCRWSDHAKSLDGAIAALRLVQEISTSGETNPMVPPMIAAVLGYLES